MKPHACTSFLHVPIILVILLLPTLGCGESSSTSETTHADPRIAAKVGNQEISMDELEQATAIQAINLEKQLYNLKQQRLDQMIGDILLEREAERRGISVTALVQAEIEEKSPTVTDADVDQFMQQPQYQARKNDEVFKQRVREYLNAQKSAGQKNTFVQLLRTQAGVEVFLSEPEPPIVDVSEDDDPYLGPANAPVTIIEFSEFQCPYCKRTQPVLKQIRDTYGDKVKLVFRDFPLSNHQFAKKSAEAAQCASEQGKFWEYHDKLFEKSPQLTIPDLKRYAQELELDTQAFNQCLDDGKYQREVEEDLADGSRVGVSGTPTFFINGRYLSGAQPYSAFDALIKKALEDKS